MIGNNVTGDSKETRITRRRALSLAGAALVGSVGATGGASASDHAAEVYWYDGSWWARNGDNVVYWGNSYRDAIQAAVDSLTAGRDWKETVVIWDSGTFTAHEWDGDLKAVDLPSYTVIDQRGTLTVDDSGEDLVVPYRARSATAIEIRNATIEGNPRYGIWLRSCSDVQLGSISMSLWATEDVGIGIRIDDSDGGRSWDVSLEYAYVEGAEHHAVETYGVDDVDIGTVETVDTGGCGLLLNDTAYATVGHVDATRADQGGGYAGFRCANGAGPEIAVDRVDAVGCGRGIFTVSGSSGITITDVWLEDCGSGALIQDTRDTTIDGGAITGNAGEGVRIDSRSSDEHHHTRNVTIRNLTIENNDYGVYETGPDTEDNAVLDNEFCNNATADAEIYSPSTTVSGNTFCGGSGGSIATGTYRITSVNSGKFLEVADASTENGATVQQHSDTGHACQEWRVEAMVDGVYRIENAHSGKVLDVAAGSTADGADVIQWDDGGYDNQRWYVYEDAPGEYVLEAVHSGKVADVDAGSTADGANVHQWSDNGRANQRWYFDPV